LGAFGTAWAELGDFDRAVASYREAVREGGAQAPLSAVEQLANLELRYAARLREERAEGGAPAAGPDPDELIREAATWLEWLLRLGETTERLSMLGSLYKHLALAAAVEQQTEKLEEMLQKARDYYGQAHRATLQKTNTLNPYPALNWVAYRFLLGDRKKKELLELIADCQKAAVKKRPPEPSFWDRVTEPCAELLRRLVSGALPGHQASVLKQKFFNTKGQRIKGEKPIRCWGSFCSLSLGSSIRKRWPPAPRRGKSLRSENTWPS
jgi:hypothetical protein